MLSDTDPIVEFKGAAERFIPTVATPCPALIAYEGGSASLQIDSPPERIGLHLRLHFPGWRIHFETR